MHALALEPADDLRVFLDEGAHELRVERPLPELHQRGEGLVAPVCHVGLQAARVAKAQHDHREPGVAARPPGLLENRHILDPELPSPDGGAQAGAAAADYHQVGFTAVPLIGRPVPC